MQQILSMAQSLGQSGAKGAPDLPGNLTGLLRGGVDSNQQALLSALRPYLRQDKVARLEKAMQAAGMARMASSFLGAGGLQLLTGGANHVRRRWQPWDFPQQRREPDWGCPHPL